MDYFPLYFYLQQTIPSLKLPYHVLYPAIDWLIGGLIDRRIDEVQAIAIFYDLFSLVNVAHLALVLVFMELIEDTSVGLFAEAKGTAFFECFLPSSKARTDHEVINEPLEG